jgi:hypothetical protein
MDKHEPQEPILAEEPRPADRPDYEPPQVLTYRGKDILEQIGPAQACSFNHSVVLCV